MTGAPPENSRVHYTSTLADFEADVTRLLRRKGVRPIKEEWVKLLAEYLLCHFVRNHQVAVRNGSGSAGTVQCHTPLTALRAHVLRVPD